ncbi:MAG: ABC transporter ATP-binding protein [Alcaligenaceae bacterium]|nr:ABC transporter ATP-binding protein [Alcaligenaceae bacterium]
MELKLSIRNLHASYGGVRALQGVSMDLRGGETVALLGTNGNGKSTLINCVLNIVPATEGEIILDMDGQQHDLTRMATEDIVNLGIGVVPEGRRLFPWLTVEENLLLGAYRHEARRHAAESLESVYEVFPVLRERRRQLAGSMSGGQQQMVAIARAIMLKPRLLLVDEPSVGLSPLLVQQTINKLIELKETFNLSVLMAEQNFEQTSRLADRGYIIVHGKIAFEGSLQALRENDLVKNLYLGL